MLVYPDCMEYDWSGGPFLPFWLKDSTRKGPDLKAEQEP
jgi:hypothetical protein